MFDKDESVMADNVQGAWGRFDALFRAAYPVDAPKNISIDTSGGVKTNW